MVKLTTQEFISRAKLKHNNFYSYEKTEYIDRNLKVIITCPKHGDFEQTPPRHTMGQGCPKCARENNSIEQRLTTEEFINRAKLKHNNFYSYDKVVYVDSTVKVIITCPTHGDYAQLPTNHLSGQRCPFCAHKSQFSSTEDFIEKAKLKHNNFYSYEKTEYVHSLKNVIITCPKHGDFEQVPNYHLSGRGCSECGEIRRSKLRSSSTEEFISRAKLKHNNFYSYEKTEYVSAKDNVIITCPTHGDFAQIACNHLSGTNCPECALIIQGLKGRLTTEEFIERASIKHNNKYDYSKVEYIKSNITVTITCPKHGDFEQAPNNHLYGQGCPKCGIVNLTLKLSSTTEEFIERAKEIHNNKYDYSKVEYVNKDINVSIICPEHGIFEQSPNNHLAGKGCSLCAFKRSSIIKSSTTEEFIERAKEIHNNFYSYADTVYENAKVKVSITCPKHGNFIQSPDKHLIGQGCPKCSSNTSAGEREVLEYIKSIIPNEVISSDRPDFMYGGELDIYIPDLKIAIEYDGLYYHNELFVDKNYHKEKTVMCESVGIQLIHLFEDEWVFKKDIVKSRLKNLFRLNTNKLHARKCKIVDLSKHRDIVNHFLDNNHIQGKTGYEIAFGLIHSINGMDMVVSVMTFNKPKPFSGTNNIEPGSYELSRFCSLTDYNVSGGASRLLAHFIKVYDPSIIISYADRRWSYSKSNVYEKLGFPNKTITDIDYSYIVGDRRKHRSTFTKYKLVEKYGCRPDDTEKNFCFTNGIYRIYDCGKITYKMIRL